MRLTRLALVLGLAATALLHSACSPDARASAPEGAAPASILDHRLDDIDGESVHLGQRFGGRVLLLVNVASRCGYTPQYEGLEALYETYRDRGFAVLGFPSNDFGGQEPGSNEEIKTYCRATWGVKFPMFAKLRVRGPQRHPLYAKLAALEAPLGGDVAWNFEKFLVDRDGRVRARFRSRVEPDAPELIEALEALLPPKS